MKRRGSLNFFVGRKSSVSATSTCRNTTSSTSNVQNEEIEDHW
jgi:hypothetical protein